jgi:hypothetical protein
MSKTIRESKMLQEVRRWRAEAYASIRGEPVETRVARAKESARRLNLPMLDDEAGPTRDADTFEARHRRTGS